MSNSLNLENINYIKIMYKDSEELGHCAKAAIKSMNEREIFVCLKCEQELKVPVPQEVDISFACDNALYTARTTLKLVEEEDPYLFFTLLTPKNLEYKQNREYFRVQMTEDVILSFDDNIIPSKIYDISANGIKLVLDKNFNIPDDVSINILFSPQNVKVKAKYIRTDDEDNILKASFYFSDISEQDRDIISQRCIQKQLSDRRKSLN